MIDLLILLIGLPLSAWLIMHAVRLSLKAVKYLESRND